MSNRSIFSRYIQMGEVLGKLFPDMLEVIVHDFKDLDHSIIFIINGHLSGRKVGGPITELGLRRLLNEQAVPDALVNYSNYTLQSGKLKSASLAIRDDKGELIGAFCLNFPIAYFEQFRDYLDRFLKTEPLQVISEELVDSNSSQEEIHTHIQRYLLKHHLHFSQLTSQDKQEIIRYLSGQHIFKRKGAVTAIAKELKMTRQSIYNYLKSLSINKKG